MGGTQKYTSRKKSQYYIAKQIESKAVEIPCSKIIAILPPILLRKP